MTIARMISIKAPFLSAHRFALNSMFLLRRVGGCGYPPLAEQALKTLRLRLLLHRPSWPVSGGYELIGEPVQSK